MESFHQLDQKFLKPPAGSPVPVPPDKPAPKITSISPAQHVGEPMSFTVTGSNFLAGASATISDESGNPVAATLTVTDANTVQVKANITATNPYTAILTITNPDKQYALYRFQVA